MKQKLILALFMLSLGIIGAQAQGAGLSQGEAVKAPKPTATKAKKTCPNCGITMGNITYPWQHEEWCPYYRERNSGGGGGGGTRVISSPASSNAGIIAGGIAAGLGGLLSNAINKIGSEDKADYSIYKNTKQGGFLNWTYAYDPNKEQRYVVVRAGDKVGIWENSWTSSSSKKRYPGEWMIKPKKYDYIWMSYSGLSEGKGSGIIVGVVGVKQKNSDAMFYGLNEANQGWGSGNEILKPDKYTKFKTVRALENTPLVVAFGYTDKQGREQWDLWTIAYRENKKFDHLNAVQMGGPYDDATVWDKYVRVTNGGRSRMLDHFGKDVFNRDFAQVGTPFGPTKMAWAQDVAGGKYGVIDSLGRSLLPCQYDDIRILDRGVLLTKGGKKGYYYANGNQMPCEYDKIREYGSGLLVEKDGNTWIEHAGKSIPLYLYNTEEEIQKVAEKRHRNFEDKTFEKWYAKESAAVREQYMKKDQFEKESDYKIRIADKAAVEKYVSEKMGDAMSRFLTQNLAKDSLFISNQYDSEMECFEFFPHQCPWNAFRYPVSIDEAKEFDRWFRRAEITDRMLRFDTPAVKQCTLKLWKPIGKYGGREWISYDTVLDDN